MALMYRVRPSSLMAIDDPYTAWCLDEAVAEYALRIDHGETPRPEPGADDKPTDNLELIRQIKAQAQSGFRVRA